MLTTETGSTLKKDREVLVRVCCSATCTKPQRVFGCKLDSGDSFYCDDCRSNSPALYLECAVRGMVPFSSQVTHGFCRECAQEVMAAAARHRKAKACSSPGR